LCSPRPSLRISVYLPVYPAIPQSSQNPLLHSEVIDALSRLLDSLKIPPEQARSWCDRLVAAAGGISEPGSMVGTLAVFLDDLEARIFPLSSSEPLLVAIGERYRLRPLLAALQREHGYALLALSARRVTLLEGSSWGLRPAAPEGPSDALEGTRDWKALEVSGELFAEAPEGPELNFGLGTSTGKSTRDLEHFHRVVAEATRRRIEGRSDPLILAADLEHQSSFRAVAGIPSLVPEGIDGDPELLTPRALHARAWPIVRAAADREEREELLDYQHAREKRRGTERLSEVANSAVAGRIDRLWIAADSRSPGRIDPRDGRILRFSRNDDVLDDLAAIVLHNGGKVRVVDEDSMPGDSFAAAQYR
jgi:hypothetical protein